MTHPALATVPVLWHLPNELVQAIKDQATLSDLSPEDLAIQALWTGLAELGLTRAGRCAVRTGQCSEGPKPLPLQQMPSSSLNA